MSIKMRSRPPAHHRRPSAEAMTLRKLSTISEDTLTAINEPFQFHDADVMLVSSDGLGFRAHSSKLGRCSNIFRTTPQPTALPTPPSSPNSSSASSMSHIPEIHFVDPTLENGITLSLFLHLSYSLPLPILTLPIYFQAYETLVEFLRKWECTVLYPVLSSAVGSWLEDGLISSSKGFKIGDALGSERLLVESVKRGGEFTWAGKVIEDPSRRRRSSSNFESRQSNGSGSPPQKTEIKFDVLRDGLPGEASLDLTAVPFEYFVALSDEVKFALLRASRAGVKERQETDWDEVAEEFERVLTGLRRAK